MKLGISLKIDVSKIDKSRLFSGKKGTYLDLTTFIDADNPSKYGDHGFISQSVSKEEREQGVQTPILGNAKIFYGLQSQPTGNNLQSSNYQGQNQGNQNQGNYQGQNQGNQTPDDDIPF